MKEDPNKYKCPYCPAHAVDERSLETHIQFRHPTNAED